MTKEELRFALNRIGKSAFVEHFEVFQEYFSGTLSVVHLEEDLLTFDRGSAWRLPYARKIFQSGQEYEALAIVASPEASPRIPEAVRGKAQVLMTSQKGSTL